MTVAQSIAAFAGRLTFDDIPPEVTERTLLHVLDVLGCGLAARRAGVAGQASDWAAAEGGGSSALLGVEGFASPAEAALANGMLCHGLDFDDTHPAGMLHVSTVVVPAALAVAQSRRASGRDLLTAIVAGSETAARIGIVGAGTFHERGLHPTAVCGVFGAAVAAAKLRDLDPSQTTHALGIAGSTAAGLFEYLADGTATKPFHAGWAAHAGVVAASLAALGATGPASVLEGRFGLFRALLDIDAGEALRAQVADLGERWETLAIAIKPYPACHFTHAAMDGARRLGVRAEDVESIELEVPESAVGIVLEPAARKVRPATSYEAKFSLQYCVAAMLSDGSVDLATYDEPRLGDPAVLDLAARVGYSVVAPDGRGPFFTVVKARLRSGETVVADVPHPAGTPEAPLSAELILDKYKGNAGPGLERFADEVFALAELPDVSRLRLPAVPMQEGALR
jgi:2-methylcitrate dehydratase PrpD